MDKMKIPLLWKKSTIVPVVKPGKDASLPASYRPIALTSNLCKIMEQMVKTRLMWYLNKHNLLSPGQSGFRANRSTTDHLVSLETSISNALLNKEYQVCVFLDLEKAYDMLWRTGVLIKMQGMGIRVECWVGCGASCQTALYRSVLAAPGHVFLVLRTELPRGA